MVFVVKYRRPVITEDMSRFMKDHAAYLCERFNGELVSAEADRDHIHLLVSLPPDVAPGTAVCTLKTQLSREVRARYPGDVKKYLWGDNTPFWTASYYISTTGTTNIDRIREYIESQQTEEHKRKYVKSGKYKKAAGKKAKA